MPANLSSPGARSFPRAVTSSSGATRTTLRPACTLASTWGALARTFSFGLQLPDYSLGRVGGVWQLTTPTPNAQNVAAVVGSSTNLSINEWLANAPAGGTDWLELFNRSSNAPVALRNIYLRTSNDVF